MLVTGNCYMASWCMPYRLPQDYIVSLMLFSIYIKLFEEAIQTIGLSCHQYTDDTLLYCILTPDFRETEETEPRPGGSL